MSDNYVPPEYKSDAFHCPHCNVYAKQYWSTINFRGNTLGAVVSKCQKCDNHCIWKDKQMYYPKSSSAPLPHEHMPDDITENFNEARQIVDDSPRAAAALLRLALQKLLEDHLDTPGDGIYNDIGHLVDENEIQPRVQKMLDGVRITGNNSVHPGRMDMDDNRETALALFKLLNYTVDETIGRDKEVEEFWEMLPEEDKQGVKNRDN